MKKNVTNIWSIIMVQYNKFIYFIEKNVQYFNQMHRTVLVYNGKVASKFLNLGYKNTIPFPSRKAKSTFNLPSQSFPETHLHII